MNHMNHFIPQAPVGHEVARKATWHLESSTYQKRHTKAKLHEATILHRKKKQNPSQLLQKCVFHVVMFECLYIKLHHVFTSNLHPSSSISTISHTGHIIDINDTGLRGCTDVPGL